MPITAPSPITKPAEVEQTFDHLRVRNLACRTARHGEGTVYIETIPEDANGNTDQGTVVDEIREPLYEILANVPEAAQVYSDFIAGLDAALPAIRAYIENRDNPEQPPE